MANNEPNIASTRTRTLLIIVAIMLIIGVLVALYSFSKGKKTNKMVSPTSGIPNNIYVTPGAKSSEKYVKLQESANMAGTKKAAAQGKTFVPTIVGNKSDEANQSFNNQLNNALKDKYSNNTDSEKLSKQLAELLARLNTQGQEIDNLLHLIQELQNRGYNVADLEQLLKKLMAEGYNTNELAALLKQLQAQGYKVHDLEEMLNRLLKEGYDPTLINNILDKMLKDRLKELEDDIKQLQNAGYDTKNLQHLIQQINNPDLTKLLEQFANQGYKVDSLDNLLKQLMNKGYNVFDWNMMLQQLQKDGYDVEKLQKLLQDLKAQGTDINNLKDILDALSKKNNTHLSDLTPQQPETAHKNLLKEQLYNVFSPHKDPPKSTSNNNNQITLDQEYAALIKKQHDAALAEEQAKKRAQENMLKNKQLAVNAEAQQKIMNEILANMRAETDTDINLWNNIPQQNFTQGDLAAGKIKEQDNNSIQHANNINTLATVKMDNDNTIIKAGTILFAVLETAINSDEPGPILARIVQPPLKNTKLIGSVQPSTNNHSETLILNFNTANIPERIRSYGISAVAIDPNTARTAMASDVDHHYLLRWGTVFAATFLQGYAKGIAQSGTTVTSTNNGAQTNTTVNQQPLNPRQQFYQGVADMATTWGQGASQFSNRPVTITINAGISVGVLFTSDFVIPTSDETSPPDNAQQLSTKQPTPNNHAPVVQQVPAAPAAATPPTTTAQTPTVQQQPPNTKN